MPAAKIHRRGVMLAIIGFAMLSCGDAIIKTMTGEWPIPAVAALRFAIAVPFLTAIVAYAGPGQPLRIPQLTGTWWHVARGAAIASASALFFYSLTLMPLAAATSIAFAQPVITAILSAILLKEPLHPRGWLAVLCGMAGVLIVLKPNLAALGALALVPLAAAFCMSCLFLLNRHMAGRAPSSVLQWSLALFATPILVGVALVGHFSGAPGLAIGWPDWTIVARCAFAAFTATSCHWLIFLGTARASAAAVAPATYAQLPVALALDALLFGNYPDVTALAGGLLIIAAGILLLSAPVCVARAVA